MIFEKLEQIVCLLKSGGKVATAFFINNELALTVLHGLEEFKDIKLYLKDSVSSISSECIAHNVELDIALLKVSTPLAYDDSVFFDMCSSSLSPGTNWISRGYPNVKGNIGSNFHSLDQTINQVISFDRNITYNIELNHELKLDSYEGVSGSPLIVDSNIVGIINNELVENSVSKELYAISVPVLKEFLLTNNISVVDRNSISQSKNDLAGENRWNNLTPEDKRNLRDKMESACRSISKGITSHYLRNLSVGEADLSIFSERSIKSMKYRIFETCQETLIFSLAQRDSEELSEKDILNLIDKFQEVAVKIIRDKSIEHNYPNISDDLLKKIVLILINDCYLSFDNQGIYNEN